MQPQPDPARQQALDAACSAHLAFVEASKTHDRLREERRERFLTARETGASLREIAAATSLTYERVRTVLDPKILKDRRRPRPARPEIPEL